MLKTPRLRLKPLTLPDAAWIEALAGDARVAETLLKVPHPYPKGLAQDFIRASAVAFREGRDYTFGLWREGEPLGVASLRVRAGRGVLGYWLGVPYWGQGYATEAARALLAFGFGDLGLRRVEALCLARNLASARVLEKIGLKREGLLKGYFAKDGRVEDAYLYGLVKEEWDGAADPDL